MKKFYFMLMSLSLMCISAMADVNFTVLGGSNKDEGEGCDKAFDGNLATKWGMWSGDAWVSLDAGEEITLTGYTLTTANDNKQYGRLPIEWEIYGTNDASSATGMAAASELKADGTKWELVYMVHGTSQAQQVQREDFTAHYFAQPYAAKAYRYYAFKMVIGGSQLSEIQFSYTKNKNLTYTFVEGSSGLKDDEGPAKVFDGLGSTKICSNTGTSDRYLIFKTNQPTKVAGYTFITGNDATDRDPRSWTLYGMSSESDPSRSDEGWVKIDNKSDITMTSARKAHQHYTVNSPSNTEYNYFKLEVGETGGGLWQFQEFFLTTESEDLGKMFCYHTNGGFNNEEAWHILDGRHDTKLCGYTGSGVIFGNGQATSLSGYMLKVAYEYGNYDRYPSSVTFYGSNADGCPGWDDAWTEIETITEDVSNYKNGEGTWYLTALACRYYRFSQPTAAYKYFKFVVNATMGAGITQISELQPFYARGDVQKSLETREGLCLWGEPEFGTFKYQRSLEADKWYTFCTFQDEAASTFDNVKELTGVSVSGENFTMNFDDASSIEAGKPYMVKVNSDKTYSLTKSNYTPNGGTIPVTVDDGAGNTLTFSGVLSSDKAPQNSFIISNNNFYKVNSDVSLKATRGYVTATAASSVKALNFSFDDNADGINAIDNGELTIDNAIYNVAGQRLQKMQKGINIVNGKKVLY